MMKEGSVDIRMVVLVMDNRTGFAAMEMTMLVLAEW